MANKYSAKKTEVDGFVFDSKAEAHHYSELKYRQMAGEISELELQPRFECVVNDKPICTYIADFRYKENTDGGSRTVIEDVKGVKTDVYKIKKKLVEALYGIEIVEIN